MNALAVIPQAAAIEHALIQGDLSKLNVEQRLSYYKAVCDSVGLNPLTKPFDYLSLNGKLVLYAKRDATDQLRKIHGVSVHKLESQKIEDVYVVTAYVRDKDGREDSSTGAVSLGNLKGDTLANALMKAETKAKRRATLSICGLGLLDETEVSTIPDAHIPTKEELESGAAAYEAKANVSPAVKQVLNEKPKKPIPAKVAQWELKQDQLFCFVYDAQKRQGKKGPFVALKHNGQVMDKDAAFCFHERLFDAILASRGKMAKFLIDISGDYVQIADVIQIEDQEYRDCTPYTPEAETSPNVHGVPISDDDIPF